MEKLLQIAVNEENQIDNKIKEIGASTKRVCSNEKCSKLFYCLKKKCGSCGGVAGPPHTLSHWGGTNFSKRGNFKVVWSNLV